MDNLELMIVAGEASGDYHGSALVHAITRLKPGTSFFGIGGEMMAASGVDITYHVRDLGVTGFTEVAGRLPFILKVLRWAVDTAVTRRPSAVILIDYPDFNLRLAQRLHTHNIRVFYYISPQLWAWRSGRVTIIRRCVDTMFVLFPFEAEWYRDRGVNARYIGNPIVDRFEGLPSREECRSMLNIPSGSTVLALVPGSRKNEVARLLPVMLAAVKQLRHTVPDLHCILPLAPTIDPEFIHRYLTDSPEIDIRTEPSPQVLRAADFAWVTSGTATLETAMAGTPMVIVYRTSWASYWLAKWLVNIEFIGMANLVAGRSVATELIQGDCRPERLVAETLPVLNQSGLMAEKRSNLQIVKDRLGQHGAADRAADMMVRRCEETVPEKN